MKNFLTAENKKSSKKKKLNKPKIIIGILIILLLIGAFGFFLVYSPVAAIKNTAVKIIPSAKKVSSAFKNNDIDEVRTDLAELEKNYNSFQKEAKKIYWISYIPFLGSYVSDFKHSVSAGDSIIKTGIIATDAIFPYADLIGFKKGTDAFLEKSADDRIQTAVLTLDKVLVKADDIASYIDKTRNNLWQIDENRYPVKIGKYEIREKIKKIKEQFEGVASLFVDAKPFLKKLPEILGTEEERTYLILFQNDKELRPTGGFLTAYAIFKVKNGKLKIVKSEDIYSLDNLIPKHPKAPKEILTYHKGVSVFNIRDSNLSPDLVKSLEYFNSLYDESKQKIDYDGVITVDTKILVDMLEILGDTEADGVVFSAKKDKRCDCPQVIYKLFDMVDRPVAYIKENRKGILGDLLYVIMQKALGFSPSRYWGKLSQNFIKNLQEKHMLLYFKDQEIQQSIEKINFGGRIKDYKGDYLHINDTNFAGAKSNLFVSHTIISDTEIKEDGSVERTLIIEYKNPYKHSDCNLERGGLCLNAILRNWLRIYVPEGSKLITFQGSEKKVNTYNNLSKTVFEGFLQVKPEGKSTVIVKYKLPFKVQNKKDYSLLIQKQPGTLGHLYKISINGKEKEQFKLLQDKEFKMK